ncbi:MAG: glycosyltransferase family 2 protein [Pseudomonadota bacterium]
MITFSFVIPAYNYADYLPKTLDSILKQQGDDYEIIVVNDGSTDNTDEVMRDYLNRYNDIISYYKQVNQGPAAARNFAVSKAKGAFIFALDADDCLTPSALHVLRQAIETYPDKDLIAGNHFSVWQDGRVKTKQQPKLSDNKEANFIAFIRKQVSIPCGTSIVRREVFDKIQYYTDIVGREDTVFVAQVLACYPAVMLDNPIVKRMMHDDSFRYKLGEKGGYDLVIADKLFDPEIIPETLMPYKKEYKSRLCLAFFRNEYKAGHYKAARKWYYLAIKTMPRHVFHWNYLSKFLKSKLKIQS